MEEERDEDEDVGSILSFSSACVTILSLITFTNSTLSYTAHAAASIPLLTFLHLSALASR